MVTVKIKILQGRNTNTFMCFKTGSEFGVIVSWREKPEYVMERHLQLFEFLCMNKINVVSLAQLHSEKDSSKADEP